MFYTNRRSPSSPGPRALLPEGRLELRHRLAHPVDELDRVPLVVEAVVERDAATRRLVHRDLEVCLRRHPEPCELAVGGDRTLEELLAFDHLAARLLDVDQQAE